MIRFTDGPAADKSLSLKRAPLLLRVVFGPRGAVDALDQLNDTPNPNERIVVYRAITKPTQYHILARGKGGKALTGWWARCEYAVLPDDQQPDDVTARNMDLWRAWCNRVGPALFPHVQVPPPDQRLRKAGSQ